MRYYNKIIWILTLVFFLGLALTDYRDLAANEDPEKKQTEGSFALTVLDFGAVGDGRADDTEAIQKAVDSGIGTIRFPKGIYRITKTIMIELDKVGPVSIDGGGGTARIVMAGAGPALKFIGTHEGSAGPSTFKENVWQNQRMPTIDGLEIVGEHPEAVGIEVTGTMQATFTRVFVHRALHGIHLTKRNRNVIISECHLYHNSGIGIFLDRINLHQINITNCHISYNGAGGIVVHSGPGGVRNLQISGCDIEGNMDPNGPPTANVLLVGFTGGVAEGAIVGCTLQHTHSAPNSANIRFIGSSEGNKPRVKNFTIADNALSDVSVNIDIQYARAVTIMGNTIWRGFSRDILVENSSNIIVGPNIFDRSYDWTPENKRGILFRDCTDCILSGMQIKDVFHKRGGLVLERCRRFNVKGCSIYNFEGCGILLDDVEHVRVSDCMILDYRPDVKDPIALRLIKGKNNMIVGNLFGGKVEIAPQSAHIEDNFTSKK